MQFVDLKMPSQGKRMRKGEVIETVISNSLERSVHKMVDIKRTITLRIAELKEMIGYLERSSVLGRSGRLRISTSKNRTQYYLVQDSGDPDGSYLKKNQVEIARELAQKDYILQVLNAAKSEQEKLLKLLKTDSVGAPEKIYDHLSEERKALIAPIRLSDEEFARKWSEQEYQTKGIPEGMPTFQTERGRGELVRSKSEMIIADMMYHMGIPYRYECPIYLSGETIHPDFTVLNRRERKEYYLEHLGRMDDPQYCADFVWRLFLYEENRIFPGENLLFTFESDRQPLRPQLVRRLLEKYLL